MKAIRLAILGALAGVQSVDFMLAMHAIDPDADQDVQRSQIVTALRAIGNLAETNIRFLEMTSLPTYAATPITGFVDEVLSYALIFRDCTPSDYEDKVKLFSTFVDKSLDELGHAA